MRPRPAQTLLPVALACAVCAVCAVAVAMPEARVVSGVQGGPAIRVNGQTLAPVFCAANNEGNRDALVVETLRRAAGADIPLFSFTLPLAWHMGDEEAAALVEQFCAAHPRGYFYVRVPLAPDRAWLEAHPGERITLADGRNLEMASPSSVPWREEARRQLVARVRQIAGGPHGDRFIGVAPVYLDTGAWLYPEAGEFGDYSAPNTAAFRDWLRATYGDVGALRAAWGRPALDFDTVDPPGPALRDASAWGPFRDPVRHRPAADFQRFQSALMADTIAWFARAVKAATDGRALVGAFYGYTFALSHTGPRALANSGHLALGRLLECEDIDLIHAPCDRFGRAPGAPGHFRLPIDSVALHGKLAVIEDDTGMHRAAEPEDAATDPGGGRQAESLEEPLALTRRNYGNALAHRCGLSVLDPVPDGRWNDNVFWASTALLRRVAAELRGAPPFQPEVAVLVSEEAVHHLRTHTHPWLLESARWRGQLARLGAPVGYYLQRDLGRLPRSVRVILLANAYALSDAERTTLERFARNGGTVVYTCAAGAIDPERGPSVARVGRVTGFDVAARWDADLVVHTESTGETTRSGASPRLPRLIIDGLRDGQLHIARYAASGDLATAIRPVGAGWVVFAAQPPVPVELLRDLCRQAGVHLYRDAPGHVARAGSYLFVHTGVGDAGELALRWPAPLSGLTRIVPHARFPVTFEDGAWTDAVAPHATAVYRCEPEDHRE